ncbi:MAG: TIGR00159 family protein, partial [Butyrivibrio sp.]|nr:TIGR00159 family protein [Butyrivibrio sp.]
MQQIDFLFDFNRTTLHMPTIRFFDVLEIFIIAFLVYNILVWAKDTRLWSLLKGVIVIVVFILIAAIFNMTTILWIVEKVVGIAITAMVVILQPELRKALEELGRKNFFSNVFSLGDVKTEERFSDKTLNEITRACVEMAKVKTGALIVIEQSHP